MTEAAQRYFRLYYQLERLIEDEKNGSAEVDDIREKLDDAYHAMTEKERYLLDIVGKDNIKEL